MTRPLVLKIDEATFQSTVVDYARTLGWMVAHFRPAMTSKGWRTPVTADGAGWPDLVLLRERLVVAELKGSSGQLRAEQRRWIEALRRAGVETYVWFPTCWGEIEQVLTTHQPQEKP